MSDYRYTGYNQKLKDRSRELRKTMTKQEKRLWYEFLRKYHVKFYRQRSIDYFIADFYCSAARLVVEVDGNQHFTDQGLEYDRERTAVFGRYGIEVIRFSNRDVEQNFEQVCGEIERMVKERCNGNTTPPLSGEPSAL